MYTVTEPKSNDFPLNVATEEKAGTLKVLLLLFTTSTGISASLFSIMYSIPSNIEFTISSINETDLNHEQQQIRVNVGVLVLNLAWKILNSSVIAKLR